MTSTTRAAAATPTSVSVGCIVARFHDLAASHPDRIAVIDPHVATTFADLREQVYSYVAHHDPAGPAVMPVLAHPYAVTIATALGIWLGGGIPLPLAATTSPKALLSAMRLPTVEAHICHPWRAHLHTASPAPRQLYLAGGEPPTDRRVGDAIGLTSGGTALLAAPLRAAAIFEAAVRQLLAGGTIVLRHQFSAEDWLATCIETGADWAVLAPGQITALLAHEKAAPGWLTLATRTLRRIVVPATAPADDLESFAALADATGAPVTAWYHAPTFDGAVSTPHHPHALTPLPGTRLRVIDPTGQLAGPGIAGLIEGSSTSGAAAHRADHPCQPATTWRSTGDIGALDHHGNLTLHRLQPFTEYVDPDGTRIKVAALRRALTEHPAITASSVHVVPDRTGHRHARVHIWTHPATTAADFAAYCTAHGAPIVPDHITIDPAPQPPAPPAGPGR